MLALGSIAMLAASGWLGRFIYMNWSMPRFAVPAIALDAIAIAALVALNVQIRLALNIDYSQPVAVIQKRLDTLRRFRIRYSQIVFLTATLIWTPLFIVVTKGFWGADIYRLFGTAWIAANIAFGVAVLAVGFWLGRKFGSGMTNSTFGQRFLRDIAGYNLNHGLGLNAASGFLATLAEFERAEFELEKPDR
jgi:hypothetical protein